MSSPLHIFWFRRDLRLDDNCGLYRALEQGLPVLPVFIFDTDILNELEDKADKRVSFIYHAILKLQEELKELGSSLYVLHGKPLEAFKNLIKKFSVHTVFTNHDYEPYAINRDQAIRELLVKNKIEFKTFKDQVIFEKNEVVKPDGSYYSVFTPFSKKWKACLTPGHYKPFQVKKYASNFYKSESFRIPTIKEIGFEKITIEKDFELSPGQISNYHQTRDIPSIAGTTRAGVHLRVGTVSVRSLVAEAIKLNETFLNELIWREFFMQMLWHEPRLEYECFRREYESIQWRNNENEYNLWKEGKTGYPIVDAGMRELNATGFMHNRVRMITASFLVKHLLIDWRWGEAYFAKKLMDYELSSNLGNWQWVAGCGCDAAPYFRIFSPDAQTKKFDSKAEYIRKWVPEFESLQYAQPVVQHEFARERCLKVFKQALASKH
jgi:deoxyribodipyrimidine photo-lyase